MPAPKVYLASVSPRRRLLLKQIGVPHALLRVSVNESPQSGEAPEALVQRLALAKAAAGWVSPARKHEIPVIGADTLVVVDSSVLGKPRDQADGLEMLRRLSGRTHEVLSAVSVVDGRRSATEISKSLVRFRPITPEERLAYWNTGEPLDKAGAYAVQGLAALFIESLQGSYSGVMGLPLFEAGRLLADFGIEPILSNRDAFV